MGSRGGLRSGRDGDTGLAAVEEEEEAAGGMHSDPVLAGFASGGPGMTTAAVVARAARQDLDMAERGNAEPGGPQRGPSVVSRAQVARSPITDPRASQQQKQQNQHRKQHGSGGEPQAKRRAAAAVDDPPDRVPLPMEGASPRTVLQATEIAFDMSARAVRIAALAAARIALARLPQRELITTWAQPVNQKAPKVLLGISGAVREGEACCALLLHTLQSATLTIIIIGTPTVQLCVLFNRKPTWESARSIVGSQGFLDILVGLDASDISVRGPHPRPHLRFGAPTTTKPSNAV